MGWFAESTGMRLQPATRSCRIQCHPIKIGGTEGIAMKGRRPNRNLVRAGTVCCPPLIGHLTGNLLTAESPLTDTARPTSTRRVPTLKRHAHFYAGECKQIFGFPCQDIRARRPYGFAVQMEPKILGKSKAGDHCDRGPGPTRTKGDNAAAIAAGIRC